MSNLDEPTEESALKTRSEEAAVPVAAAWITTALFLGLSCLVAWAAGGLWIEFGVCFGIQYVVFSVYAWPFHSEKFYDFTGMITYIIVDLVSFFNSRNTNKASPRNIVLSLFVLIWTLRLGSFLFKRILHDGGEDRRFDPIRNNLARFLMSWTLQGVWVFWCTLPVTYINSKDRFFNKHKLKFRATDYIGIIFWLFGFIFESISDYQKTQFKNDLNNKGKFINTGLWKYSRHPNYFGEIVLWWGIAISSAGIVKNQGFIVFISPFYTMLLLIFVSGIPLTEARADKKYGQLQEYQEYKKNTPVLVPFCYCWTRSNVEEGGSDSSNYQAME